jgi:formate--tetrahydrofolate ligase
MATKTALKLADVVVTEAGFGADLGAEKFLDIKCRQSGLWPDAVVLVSTVRALKMQGGVAKADLGTPDVGAVERGSVNLRRQITNLKKFGLNPVVAINHFIRDTDDEIAVIKELAAELGVKVALAKHWAEGGEGAVDLATAVKEELDKSEGKPMFLYPDELPLAKKIETIAKEIYGAAGITLSSSAAASLKEFEKLGFGHVPVCIAKTQYSFSTDPALTGAPTGHMLEVREARLSAGAGFVVAVCGDIMTMPGLPKKPAALEIGLDKDGQIVGLA